MTAPTNVTSTAVSKGNREDLENVIYRVAPEETPFISSIDSGKAKAVQHDWQTETLRTPNGNNKTLEGDTVANLNAPNLSSRLSDTCQIFSETGGVTGTQEAVDSAGRSSDLNRQVVLKGIEMKRDMETRFIGNYGSKVDESGGTPRESAGALAWLTSNVSRGVGGANGGFSSGVVTAATNGTQRTPTEALLKSVQAQCFNNGGRPSLAFMGSVDKQAFSGFTGIAANRVEIKGKTQATIVGGAEVYVGDFGTLNVVPHPYGLTRDMLLIDPEYWEVATLRPFKKIDLAVIGDSQRFELIAEKTLVSRNEKANGVVADLL